MHFSPSTQAQLETLVTIFLEENAKLNLSALRTRQSCWAGNVLDSLSLLDWMDKRGADEQLTLLDVGTGGGFPLLPLAICRPSWQCMGMDATVKKVEAVGRIVATLGLGNVSLRTGRAEELGRDPKLREQFDLVLSRAVAPIATLLEYMSPFTKVGGAIVLWKSLHIDNELAAAEKASKLLSCTLREQFVYALPDDKGERQLLIYEKVKPLSLNYPRRVGIPKKAPLS
ncbi:MAG: 16S rRNA (guanine(527)-N(7))-methyltransferase RsmG [Candidatus Peregrinibacteria bacterium]|nr:16S rRNA (guanine(527)-N(7))-methyltransferase RsmG [Candidatus Peregrinibacteria bacterium]